MAARRLNLATSLIINQWPDWMELTFVSERHLFSQVGARICHMLIAWRPPPRPLLEAWAHDTTIDWQEMFLYVNPSLRLLPSRIPVTHR